MKTLTEIAQEAWGAADESGAGNDELWAAMCQSVRLAVIEECAKACDDFNLANWGTPGLRDFKECAAQIRALKDKP